MEINFSGKNEKNVQYFGKGGKFGTAILSFFQLHHICSCRKLLSLAIIQQFSIE